MKCREALLQVIRASRNAMRNAPCGPTVELTAAENNCGKRKLSLRDAPIPLASNEFGAVCIYDSCTSETLPSTRKCVSVNPQNTPCHHARCSPIYHSVSQELNLR